MTEHEMVEQVLAHMPYANAMGIAIETVAPDSLICALPYSESHIGNAQLPALHGGALAGFMEIAATLEVARRQLALQDNVDGTDFATLGESLPVPVNVTVQYLRSATTKDCHVRAEILKLGRRSNTVLCRMWQEDEAKPVASMTGIFVRPA